MSVVLVTGSARGVGREIAFKFGLHGHKVILNCSRKIDELYNTLAEFKSSNIDAYACPADVSDYVQAGEMFAEIKAFAGNVDILVNNAGVSYIGLFNEMTPLEWDMVMRSNIYSVYNCSHLALPNMILEKKGVIINISSIWGNNGASCESVYAASKGAVNTFTKSLAKELGLSNIRVNAISCGIINTSMNACFSEDEISDMLNNVALNRMGETADVAELAYFLASNGAKYITGQIINLDGGFTG